MDVGNITDDQIELLLRFARMVAELERRPINNDDHEAVVTLNGLIGCAKTFLIKPENQQNS